VLEKFASCIHDTDFREAISMLHIQPVNNVKDRRCDARRADRPGLHNSPIRGSKRRVVSLVPVEF
jgi:hypothetical protein